MRRALSLVFVVLLAVTCAVPPVHASIGLESPAGASLWSWLSAALSWLAVREEPSPAAYTKGSTLPSLPPPAQPNSGPCTDPDGQRVTCGPRN